MAKFITLDPRVQSSVFLMRCRAGLKGPGVISVIVAIALVVALMGCKDEADLAYREFVAEYEAGDHDEEAEEQSGREGRSPEKTEEFDTEIDWDEVRAEEEAARKAGIERRKRWKEERPELDPGLQERWSAENRSEKDDAFSRANRDLALALFHGKRIGTREENFIFAPYSVSLALAMLLRGANGETASELAALLGADDEKFHDSSSSIMRKLQTLGARSSEPLDISLATASWVDEIYDVHPDFASFVEAHYESEVDSLPLKSRSEWSRQYINRWVSEMTKNMIDEALLPGQIGADTAAVLASTLYLNASWMEPFDRRETETGDFHRLDGSKVQVPLMQANERFPYAKTEHWQAASLPFTDDRLSMIVILGPEDFPFSDFEENLDRPFVDEIVDELREQDGRIVLPRFEVSNKLFLNQELEKLGLKKLFDRENADLSGLVSNGDTPLWISLIQHEATLTVDEDGMEASAATMVIVTDSLSLHEQRPFRMTVDRPFHFLVYEHTTDTILMLGAITDPS